MKLLKNILSFFLKKDAEDFNLIPSIWDKYRSKITHGDMKMKNNDTIEMYATVPIEFGEIGLKKRMSFVKKGFVYMNIENTILLVLNLYSTFLK